MPAVVEAKEGDEVPNYTLRNQDDREIRIHNYRGKALLLTFIYTRCPVPEYCTLMSNNFAQVDRELGKDPELYAKTHLLSISIDPAYDTPQVLRSYGAAHTERYQNETFAHWEFATGTTRSGEGDRGVFWSNVFPGEGRNHSGLRTVIVNPDGKVAKIYTRQRMEARGSRGRTQKAIQALVIGHIALHFSFGFKTVRDQLSNDT